jgi:hypothetical protein
MRLKTALYRKIHFRQKKKIYEVRIFSYFVKGYTAGYHLKLSWFFKSISVATQPGKNIPAKNPEHNIDYNKNVIYPLNSFYTYPGNTNRYLVHFAFNNFLCWKK